jgi:hypothetical protein
MLRHEGHAYRKGIVQCVDSLIYAAFHVSMCLVHTMIDNTCMKVNIFKNSLLDQHKDHSLVQKQILNQ